MKPDPVAMWIGMAIWFAFLGFIGYLIYRVVTWPRRFLAAVDRDDRRKARRTLDKNAKHRKRRKLPRRRLDLQRARVLGLWLLGELDEVRAELEAHEGDADYIARVHMFGVLALATEPGDHSTLQDGLAELARQVSASRPKPRVRVLAELLARVGSALAGGPITDADARAFHARAASEPLLTGILMIRVLVVAAERQGKPALRYQRLLASMTKRFPPATGDAASDAS